MSDCVRCDIHWAWLDVRNARTYESVVDRAQEWLLLFWPEARKLKLSPKSLVNEPCPPMFITSRIGSSTFGQWTGVSIQLIEPHHLLSTYKELQQVHKETPPKLRDELRDTILHEVQHAIDDKNGIKQWGEKFADHPASFHRRLDKLKRAFPVEGA